MARWPTASARLILPGLVALALAACSGGGDNNNNQPVNNPPPAPPPPNTVDVGVTLSAAEVPGGSGETGSASADFTINLDDEIISGTVTLAGVTADGVTLCIGFAGENGMELLALVEASATQWDLPASAAFTAADLAALEAGQLYVQVTTAAEPDGALRGQLITGNVQLLFSEMTGAKAVPPVTTANTATAAVTYDPASGDFVAHVNGVGLDDAFAVHVHNALAGLTGGISFDLMQDANNMAHWFTDGVVLSAAEMTEYDTGRFYLNLHTPAATSGEVRTQIAPPGVTVVYTDMTAGAVVPPSSSADSGTAATTLISATRSVAVNAYLGGPADTSGVSLNRAPAGQNGAELYALAQDAANMSIWSMSDTGVADGVFAAIENQGVYVQSVSPGFPNGALRGQIEPPMSSAPPAGSFLVQSLTPADGGTVGAMPAEIVVTFNRSVLEGSAPVERFELLRSGDDGSFTDGNETMINIVATGVTGADVTLDLTGAPAADDVYQLTVDGSAGGVTDQSGVLLDGDANGTQGGDHVASFTVDTAPTFTQVQAIFTANCAFSGCHGGASPAEGMSLAAGQAFGNIVDEPSNQSGLDRIEPFEPDNSYLIRKLEGTGSQQRMPAGGAPPLPPAEIQLIRDWTSAGAPNN